MLFTAKLSENRETKIKLGSIPMFIMKPITPKYIGAIGSISTKRTTHLQDFPFSKRRERRHNGRYTNRVKRN
jgi:hypothetical protein